MPPKTRPEENLPQVGGPGTVLSPAPGPFVRLTPGAKKRLQRGKTGAASLNAPERPDALPTTASLAGRSKIASANAPDEKPGCQAGRSQVCVSSNAMLETIRKKTPRLCTT